MLLYATAIALSAFLLFEVQPIIAKIILPWFGGAAAVWTTALMFFQLTLLGGYVYSHCSIRYLKPRAQRILHVVLLGGSLLLLPIVPSPAWKPVDDGDPTLRIVLLLAVAIGLPFFLLSTTGPLLQAWYAAARPGTIPYRLFALSNASSMLALISFPFVVEPYLTTHFQALAWSGGYAAFAVLCACIALGALGRTRVHAGAQHAAEQTPGEPPSWRLQLLWIAFPACASALLLSVTNHLTQAVAPIPFLWVLTLALYLATFILCFESDRTYRRGAFISLLAILLAGMLFEIYFVSNEFGVKVILPLFTAGLFIGCMVCHGELARLKPHPRHLTKFYLALALGGAIGGLFVAVVAPRLFDSYFELPISIVLCAALASIVLWPRTNHRWTRVANAAFLAALMGYIAYNEVKARKTPIARVRNFYGVLRVSDEKADATSPAWRDLMSGTIVHGLQLSGAELKREPTTYYGRDSGVGRAITLLAKQRPHLRVGVIGLGAGVLASYCRPGDTFQFYEINPLDIFIANRYFTFLKDCPGVCQVIPGDARLVLERQTPQRFDLLAVDAFTGDAIPIHLLTREAFALYFRNLKADGILAVHVTNWYLDLAPVVARNAEEFGRAAFKVSELEGDLDYLWENDWVLIGPNAELFARLGFPSDEMRRPRVPRALRPWTDDFSNLFQILK